MGYKYLNYKMEAEAVAEAEAEGSQSISILQANQATVHTSRFDGSFCTSVRVNAPFINEGKLSPLP